MRPDTLSQNVTDVAGPIAAGHDLVVERVDVSQRGSRLVVAVILDLADGPGALGSDLLGEVSREISAALDSRDVIPGRYTLEVSTPGVARPLTTPRHFRRAQSRLLNVRRTTAAIEDGGPREITGRVLRADESAVVLRIDGEVELTLPYDQIERAGVEVELRRMEED